MRGQPRMPQRRAKRWNEASQETLARWAAFQKDELESVNVLLRNTKLQPLVVE